MRLRFRFSKLGKVRFTSHRDLARMWERAFRRVELPLAYTEGFSPRPKVSFGLALPTGHESLAEYLDLDLVPDASWPPGNQGLVDLSALPGRLTAALPVGIDVSAAAVIDKADSLQQAVTSCSWLVEVAGATEERLAKLLADALAASCLVITREKKGQPVTDDVRPAILSASVVGPCERGILLVCDLTTQPRGVRPSELLLALDGGVEERLARRTHQWIERDGARVEPLVVAPPAESPSPSAFSSPIVAGPGADLAGPASPATVPAPHALGRAS